MAAHFEIHVNDMAAAKAFYSKVLGWSFMSMAEAGMDQPDDPSDYHLVVADDIGPQHTLSGGLLLRADTPHAPGTAIRGCTLTFNVTDCDATYKTALAKGGAEALPPTDFPGIGRCAYCEDGQGNVFGVIAPAGKEA